MYIYRVELRNVPYDCFMVIVKWIYTNKLDIPPQGSDKRKQMHEAAMRCRVYILLPYLTLDDNDDNSNSGQQHSSQEKEKEKEKETPEIEEHGPSFGMIFNEWCFSDVTLVFDDERKFAAHRFILVARSTYFRAMFEGGFSESVATEVALKEVDYEPFKLLLYFMYTDLLDGCDVHFVDYVQPVLQLAEVYGVNLQPACAAKLWELVCVDTAASIYLVADQSNLADLKANVQHYISYRFDAVSKTPDFNNMLSVQSQEELRQAAKKGAWDTSADEPPAHNARKRGGALSRWFNRKNKK
eukprot:TRINITY_DN3828_c0_g1_i1.p1 TRINITY_DN3828_c0_g1~~TRINITY_DN3828_c0_g1_i1.p1  ORF type:complete len:298 (-),score=71.19 TRINITY_DN3828_c0_g1_i1:26-919(-)